jgi:hypothetical protein
MDPDSPTTWGLCEAQQRPRLLELAANMHNGSMLQFRPCDLYQLVKGRTLWLIGWVGELSGPCGSDLAFEGFFLEAVTGQALVNLSCASAQPCRMLQDTKL